VPEGETRVCHEVGFPTELEGVQYTFDAAWEMAVNAMLSPVQMVPPPETVKSKRDRVMLSFV